VPRPSFPSAPPTPQPSFGEGMFGGASPVVPAPANLSGKRFAPLSALPPDRRLPPRREGGLGPMPPMAGPPQIAPRELPGLAPASVAKQLSRIKQIGFNCPSCLAILIIKQPEQYDGQAAPCPNCGVSILPPRIAPASPFVLLSSPNQAPIAPLPPNDSVPMGLPVNAGPQKLGLPGARKLAQAALF
jgi:hypothetical protein